MDPIKLISLSVTTVTAAAAFPVWSCRTAKAELARAVVKSKAAAMVLSCTAHIFSFGGMSRPLSVFGFGLSESHPQGQEAFLLAGNRDSVVCCHNGLHSKPSGPRDSMASCRKRVLLTMANG